MFFLKAVPMNFTGPMSFAEFLDQFKLVSKEVVSVPQFQIMNIHEHCLFTSLCCCFLQKRRLLACIQLRTCDIVGISPVLYSMSFQIILSELIIDAFYETYLIFALCASSYLCSI